VELRRGTHWSLTDVVSETLTRDDEPLALTLQNIDKRYGSAQALASASLRVRPGTVHALLGENGAGKSTLMRIAYGMEPPDAGAIAVHGSVVRFGSPADAIALGIGMVHQHFTLVPVMTVAENVALGGRGRLDLPRVGAKLRELAERTGFTLDAEARVESLSVAAQQRVEIAKALVRDARLLVLDEPTAVLPPSESDQLLRWLRTYADRGGTVVLITHKLREALAVADDVTVLRRGRTVLAAPRSDASIASLTRAMLGSVDGAHDVVQPSAMAERRSTRPAAGAPVFQADRVTLTDARGVVRVRDATFIIAHGEIVGIVGIEGSGQHELLRALAGRLPVASGTLTRPIAVGFVPEDRHRDAVLLDRSLVENVALRGAGSRHGLIDWRAFESHTASLGRQFDVRSRGPHVSMRTLSGGNQQKLVLARELVPNGPADTRALVVENPTRGLDVRAASEVHARLREVRDAGAAVVLYSSDIDEVLLLGDRVLVVFSGLVREAPMDRDEVGRLMLGIHHGDG
jgi:simple sugar transport system ATP-binding protein